MTDLQEKTLALSKDDIDKMSVRLGICHKLAGKLSLPILQEAVADGLKLAIDLNEARRLLAIKGKP